MSGMKDLFGDTPYEKGLPQPAPHRAFDGETYKPKNDYARLTGQLGRVFHVMKDGRWRTLPDLKGLCGGSEAALSARLRDLRKEKYGSHTIERRSIGDGFYQYKLILRATPMESPYA